MIYSGLCWKKTIFIIFITSLTSRKWQTHLARRGGSQFLGAYRFINFSSRVLYKVSPYRTWKMDTYESNIDPKISNGDEKKILNLVSHHVNFAIEKNWTWSWHMFVFFHNKSKSNITMRKPMKISSKWAISEDHILFHTWVKVVQRCLSKNQKNTTLTLSSILWGKFNLLWFLNEQRYLLLPHFDQKVF